MQQSFSARVIRHLPLSSVSPNPRQPRRTFDADSIGSLAASIREFGQLSPILARRTGANAYEIVAGERRVRALRLLGRETVDAIVISAFDAELAVLALVENVQRENLHFLEEAAACRAILDSGEMRQEELARRLGKSPPALANLLRLLRLPASVRREIEEGNLSERHARALLSAEGEEKQLALAKAAVVGRMSVRQLEEAAGRAAKKKPSFALRDERLLLSPLLDAVKQLRRLGIPAQKAISREEGQITVTITISLTPRD